MGEATASYTYSLKIAMDRGCKNGVDTWPLLIKLRALRTALLATQGANEVERRPENTVYRKISGVDGNKMAVILPLLPTPRV